MNNDFTLEASAQAARDQTAAAFRDLASSLGVFRVQLLDSGFTERGAETLVDTLLASFMVST